MVADRLTPAVREWTARLFVLLLLLALPVAIFAARPGEDTITVHATMPETGGWQPGHLAATVGKPLHLRLTSDDVVHGFKVGVGPDGRAHASPEVEVKPGQVTELTLTFDRPGTYTYACTRWCGPNHWRMRGTITVADESDSVPAQAGPAPLFVQLGLDIDAPHPPLATPERQPSAARGRALDVSYPEEMLARETYLEESPAGVWQTLRDRPGLAHLDDGALWDAVAALWRQHTDDEALALGAALYARDCAACHGETGAGDGVFAQAGPGDPATVFTDPALLGASNALLQGKIIRGGMGTGMPAWGALFGDEELDALLAYLWTFQFPQEADHG